MNRRAFIAAVAGIPAAAPAVAIAADTEPQDDTDRLQAALNNEPLIRLDDRVYYVRPGVLRITRPRLRILGASHAGVYGMPTIRALPGKGPLLRVAAHGAVIDGVAFDGPADVLLHARRDPIGWGDLDLILARCTFTNGRTAAVVEGRGLFADGCWFSHCRTHIRIGFPLQSELAEPREHWQTAIGGARKFQVSGCYFHHGSAGSVVIASRLIHGVQVVGCHHDGPQPLIVGQLTAATVTGNSAYRLRHAGLVLTGESEGVTIIGNAFGGERGGRLMGPAVSVRGSIKDSVITGNTRVWCQGAGVQAARGLGRGVVATGNSWGGVA